MSNRPTPNQRTILLQRAYAQLLAERWLYGLVERLAVWLGLRQKPPEEAASEETIDGKT